MPKYDIKEKGDLTKGVLKDSGDSAQSQIVKSRDNKVYRNKTAANEQKNETVIPGAGDKKKSVALKRRKLVTIHNVKDTIGSVKEPENTGTLEKSAVSRYLYDGSKVTAKMTVASAKLAGKGTVKLGKKAVQGLTGVFINRRKNIPVYKKGAAVKNKVVKGKGNSLKGILKESAKSEIRNIQDNDDAGVQLITKPRDAYYTAKRTKNGMKTAWKTTKGTIKFSAKVISGAGKILVKIIQGLTSLLGPVVPIFLIVVVIVGAIVSLVPNMTVKASDEKLTQIYLYITDLDAVLTQKIRNENTGSEGYRFYMNSTEISRESIAVKSDINIILALLDVKYPGCGLGDGVKGTLGGNNLKEEIEKLHSVMNSYNVKKLIDSESVHTEGGTILSVEKEYKIISVDSLQADIWLNQNPDYLTKDEKERFEMLKEIGFFTLRKEIETPFPEGSVAVSRNYGYYVTGNNGKLKSNGVQLSTQSGMDVSAGMSGEVTEITGNEITIESSGKKLVYSNITPKASLKINTKVKTGDVIGKTGNGTNEYGNFLEIRYYKDGRETCPYIYLEGVGFAQGNGSNDIVAVALSQLGQIGGEPYWRFMGFGGRVEWCACFVSWCANQCGYLDSNIMFRHASCSAGVAEWRRRGQFQERSSGYVPKPGDIIYFDAGVPSYAASNHIGIVQSFDGTTVYTIEGNARDAVRQCSYRFNDPIIKGYGVPLYP